MFEEYTIRLKHLFKPKPKLEPPQPNPSEVLMGDSKAEVYQEIPISSNKVSLKSPSYRISLTFNLP